MELLPFMKKRSKVTEIVAAQDIVFALAQSGVSAAYSRGGDCNGYNLISRLQLHGGDCI